MCGIVGIFGPKLKLNEKNINDMLNMMYYRGPDDRGIEIFNTKFGQLSLGHNRLAIIDLSTNGHQPMFDKEKDIVIVYNGEIYNYSELKDMLLKKGYTFFSNTDTEVLLYLYKEFGKNMLDKLRGFFAFCIYDIKKQELFLARDRLGQKPLKYFFDGEIFAFTSDLKSFYPIEYIKKELNYKAIEKFLILKYIPTPMTIFKNVFKLSAGEYLVFSLKNKTIKINSYWKPTFIPKEHMTYSEILKTTEKLLLESIKTRLIADVPLGVFLSGGIDSSVIVALLRDLDYKVDTFSIGFKESKFDERKYAREISKHFNMKNHEFLLNMNFLEDIEQIINSFDEPFADPSIIPMYYLTRETSKFVKVAIGGDGADEIFGGYKRYKIHLHNKFLDYFPDFFFSLNKSLLLKTPFNPYKNSKIGKLSRIIESLSGNYLETYYLRMTGFSKKDVFEFFKDKSIFNESIWNNIEKINNLTSLDSLLLIDQLTHLPDYILNKSDMMGMKHSLEIRTPFMDHKVVDFVNKIEDKYKKDKIILKDILLSKRVDKNLIFRKKAGFTPPIRQWFKKYDSFIHNILFQQIDLDIINPKLLKYYFELNKKYEYRLSNNLWIILVLKIWLKLNKKYIKG